MQQRLSELWYREHPAASLLQPLASAYGALLALRRRAYAWGWLRSESAGRPVVVVGNLTVGGTGKTPLTLWLARELDSQGLKVGIVSRGYGRRDGAVRTVQPDSDWREVGDEPLILARRSGCPTTVAADRVAAARSLAARGVDVIIADDGLQHLQLARDCEIVVVDGARGFGNGRLLPAGPLREPVVQLWQADAVVVNGAREHASLAQALPPQGTLSMRLAAQEAVRLDTGATVRPLAHFRGQRVHAVAGIGNPARFFAELRAHALEVIEHAFPDHHAFLATELAFADARLWYVPVTADFTAGDAHELLTRVMARVRAGAPTGGK